MPSVRLIWEAFSKNWVVSVLDIVLLTLAIYFLLRLLVGTRAMQLVKGLAALLVMILLTSTLKMSGVHWLLTQALLPGVIALVIIFQPELRMALEHIGGKFWTPAMLPLKQEEAGWVVDELTRSCQELSRQRTGALIVIERSVGLNDVIETGRPVDALISADLIRTIFFPGSPLHDGAAVVRGDRVAAAGCLLPLTDQQVASHLGLRHRAALGLSEHTDALVMVISEETGTISLARRGRLMAHVSQEALRQRLMSDLEVANRHPPWFRRRTDAASKPRP